jgi:hypothetical protein
VCGLAAAGCYTATDGEHIPDRGPRCRPDMSEDTVPGDFPALLAHIDAPFAAIEPGDELTVFEEKDRAFVELLVDREVPGFACHRVSASAEVGGSSFVSETRGYAQDASRYLGPIWIDVGPNAASARDREARITVGVQWFTDYVERTVTVTLR